MRIPFDEKSNHCNIVSGRSGRSTVRKRRGAPVNDAAGSAGVVDDDDDENDVIEDEENEMGV